MLKDLTDFSDFNPTFAEVAGAKPAEGITIDGHSFAPQLRGEKGAPREWVYVHLDDWLYVRSERWKLNNDGEFFDMKEAPYKQIPVPAGTTDKEAVASRAKLQAVLDSLIAQDTMKIKTGVKKRHY